MGGGDTGTTNPSATRAAPPCSPRAPPTHTLQEGRYSRGVRGFGSAGVCGARVTAGVLRCPQRSQPWAAAQCGATGSESGKHRAQTRCWSSSGRVASLRALRLLPRPEVGWVRGRGGGGGSGCPGTGSLTHSSPDPLSFRIVNLCPVAPLPQVSSTST